MRKIKRVTLIFITSILMTLVLDTFLGFHKDIVYGFCAVNNRFYYSEDNKNDDFDKINNKYNISSNKMASTNMNHLIDNKNNNLTSINLNNNSLNNSNVNNNVSNNNYLNNGSTSQISSGNNNNNINNNSNYNNGNSNNTNTSNNNINKNADAAKINSDNSSNANSQNDNNNDNKIDIDDLPDSAKGQIQTLYDYINKMKSNIELMEDLDPVEYIKSYIENGKGNISFETLAKGAVSLLFKEVKSVLAFVVSIVTIAILCSLLKNLQDAFFNDNISEIAFYACYALVIMILSKSFILSISVAKDAINNISEFMNALLPILVTIIGLSGGITQAVTLDPFILAAVIIIPKIYTNIIIPMILMGFVLEFANNLSKEHKISNLCKLMKQCIVWFQGIIVTMFIALLTIRGITSKTMDAVTLKTAKFAVDNFIPIVGKTFSDAITSVAGYSLIIKNAVSSIGLLIIVLILLYPIIKLILMTFIYKLSSALVEPISDSRITKSLEAAGSSMVLIISCVLTVSLMFFVLIGVMAQAGTYIVGG